MSALPGIVDAHVQQELDAPEMFYTIDRTRAQELGLTVNQIAQDINISLSSSEQVSPNFWTDPKNGIPYYMAVQTPEYRLHDKHDIDTIPIASTTSNLTGVPQQVPDLLGNVARGERRQVQSVYNQTNHPAGVRPYMPACRAATLGSAAAAINRIVADEHGKLGVSDRDQRAAARSPAWMTRSTI